MKLIGLQKAQQSNVGQEGHTFCCCLNPVSEHGGSFYGFETVNSGLIRARNIPEP